MGAWACTCVKICLCLIRFKEEIVKLLRAGTMSTHGLGMCRLTTVAANVSICVERQNPP